MSGLLKVFFVRGEGEKLCRIIFEAFADLGGQFSEQGLSASDDVHSVLEVDVGYVEELRPALVDIFRKDSGFLVATHDDVDIAFVFEGLVCSALPWEGDRSSDFF